MNKNFLLYPNKMSKRITVTISETNADKSCSERVTCECGVEIYRKSMPQHIESKRHKNIIEKLKEMRENAASQRQFVPKVSSEESEGILRLKRELQQRREKELQLELEIKTQKEAEQRAKELQIQKDLYLQRETERILKKESERLSEIENKLKEQEAENNRKRAELEKRLENEKKEKLRLLKEENENNRKRKELELKLENEKKENLRLLKEENARREVEAILRAENERMERERLLQEENERVERERVEKEEIERKERERVLRDENERREKERVETLKRKLQQTHNERKVLFEESRTKGTLGDCFNDLTKTPSIIVQEHRKLLSGSDKYDNARKRYAHEDKVYEVCCKRELVIFSHQCKVQVFEIL